MSTQDRKLFDLLDGFEMTKSEYDWLERRFENMTAKESMLFRGAMQIERPEKTCDVLQLINQLDHYELFYGAGDDIGLGHFVMDQTPGLLRTGISRSCEGRSRIPTASRKHIL